MCTYSLVPITLAAIVLSIYYYVMMSFTTLSVYFYTLK